MSPKRRSLNVYSAPQQRARADANRLVALYKVRALHCRSVSGSIVTAPLERESVLGIDPAIGVSTARGGHALGVAGELAIARIAPYAPLQAVATRCALISPGAVNGAICLSPSLPVC
jgi:hypothetical protein